MGMLTWIRKPKELKMDFGSECNCSGFCPYLAGDPPEKHAVINEIRRNDGYCSTLAPGDP